MSLRNRKLGPREGGNVESDVENSSEVPQDQLEVSLQEPGIEQSDFPVAQTVQAVYASVSAAVEKDVECTDKRSGKIEELLTNVLNAFSSIQAETEKSNERLAKKLQMENEKLACRIREENKMLLDTFKQNMEQETEKVKQDVGQLRKDTDEGIQLLITDFDKLASNLNDKVARHVSSSKLNHEILCNEVRSDLSVTKQELDTFRQDASKQNLEIQNRFNNINRNELETKNKISEINQEVEGMKKQMVEIRSKLANQLSNNLRVERTQVQPTPAVIDVASNTSLSNTSFVNGSVETGCSFGVNVSSSHENAGSHTPARLLVPTSVNHIIPELSLPTFSNTTQNAGQFLKDMDDYFQFRSVDDSLKLPLVTKAITDEFAKSWLMATKANIHSYEEFKLHFLNQFWSQGLQAQTRAQIYRCKYDKTKDGTMASYLLKYANLGASLQPRMEELEIVEAVAASFPVYIQRHLISSNIQTIQDALIILNKLDAIEIHEGRPRLHNHQQGDTTNYPRPQNYNSDRRYSRNHDVRQVYVEGGQNFSRNRRYTRNNCNGPDRYRDSGRSDRRSTPQAVVRSSNLNAEAQSYPNSSSSSPGVEPNADDAENYNRAM
jgi:hypothetical protein